MTPQAPKFPGWTETARDRFGAKHSIEHVDADRVLMAFLPDEVRTSYSDAITVIKDLKVKGSSLVVKMGTKVKNIRVVEGDHDIDCRIDGIGAMQLKSEFVKKT